MSARFYRAHDERSRDLSSLLERYGTLRLNITLRYRRSLVYVDIRGVPLQVNPASRTSSRWAIFLGRELCLDAPLPL
jgi:hypothetical protein